MVLFACDLDNTIIYSHKVMGEPGDVLVERYQGNPCSYMTGEAYQSLQTLQEKLLFVPVTTRSLDQYRRISLLEQGCPRYALTSNGGTLLVDGEADLRWQQGTARLVAPYRGLLEGAAEVLEKDRAVCRAVELVDGLFLFTKSRDPQGTLAALEAADSGKRLTILATGEKVYAFPGILDKGLGVRRLQERLGPRAILSAGDTVMDFPMLRLADRAMIPGDVEFSGALGGDTVVWGGERRQFGDEVLAQAHRFAQEYI